MMTTGMENPNFHHDRILQDIDVAEIDVEHWPLRRVNYSDENNDIYNPLSSSDPEMIKLADSIAERGILDPLVVTSDGYLVSGHRRRWAAEMCGLSTVPVRVLPIAKPTQSSDYQKLLRDFNLQREKSVLEKIREEMVSTNPDDAHAELQRDREERSDVGLRSIRFTGHTRRIGITKAKRPFLDACLEVIYSRQAFWPLSVRGIHYPLLNRPPLTHASKPKSRYRNDKSSYNKLVDILGRGRIFGEIPWHAIADETRPVTIWQPFDNVRHFVRQETNDLFAGYWRNLLQSQTNHVECLGEKNTIQGIIKPVAREFCMPLTIGRGYSSLSPRYEMAKRFRQSGKERLVLLIVSDFDPDGECIAESFGRSMQEDFGVDIHAVKVAVNLDHVAEFDLKNNTVDAMPKKDSSRYQQWCDDYGTGQAVYEVEAIDPGDLQEVLRKAIRSVIDVDAFNYELDQEREESKTLAAIRRNIGPTITKAIEGQK